MYNLSQKQHGDIYYSSRKSFNSMQYTREVMQDIIKEDKGFWRSEKTYIRSACDSMAVLQKGMTHSSSMLNVKAIDLLKELGYQSRSHSSRFSGNTPLTDDLFGFKYIPSVKGYTPDNNDSRNHDKIKSKEDISIYENEDYLPIAYLVSPDMKEYTFDKNQVFKNQNKMLSDMLISSVKSAYVNSPAVLTNLEELGGNYLIFSKTNTMFDEVGDLLPSQINYTINPEEDGHYYLNLPSAVDNKYRLSVNGYEISPIFDNAFYLGYYYLGESFNVTLSVDSERVYFETAMFLRSVNPEIDSKIGFTGREDDYFGVNEDENSDFNPDDENPDLNPDDENPDDPDADPDLNPDEENPDESEPVRPVQIIEGLNHTAVRDYVIEDEMQSYFVSIPNIETYPQNLRSFGNENTIYSKVSFDNDASIDYFLTAQSGGDYFAYFPGNYERAYDIYANDILLPQTRESNASKVFYLGEYNAGDEVKITLKLDANEIFFDNELFAVAEKDPLQFGGYTEERFYKRILSYIKTHDVEGNYYVQEIVPKDEKRNNLNFEERDDGFMYTKRDDSVASLEYTLTADESGQYFAYFPTDYPINYNLHVNGSLPTLNSPNYNEIREKGSDNVPYSSGNAIFESDYHAYYLGEFNAGESITVTLTFTADTVNFKKALFVRRVVGFEDEGVVRNIERVSNHFASDTNDRINKYFKKVVYDEKLPNDVVYEGTGDNHMGYKKVDAPTGNVHIEYVFEAAEADGEYYMYFPTDYERSCNLWLTRWDGTKWGEAEFKGIFYETDNYYLRNLGFISKGEKFKMTMSLLGDRVYFTEEMFMRLDRDLLESDIIRLHAMNEKTEFKAVNSRHMRVNSDYDTKTMLFTSIPNEPGWRASLNGKRVEIEETAGGLIVISLPPGENRVDLKFFPKRMPEGILLAILGLIGLVGLNFVAFKFGGLEKLPVRGLIKSKKRREDGIVTDDVDIFDGFDSDYVEEESDSDDFDFDIEVPKGNKEVKEAKAKKSDKSDKSGKETEKTENKDDSND
ncbi:MAG: YfhO family protein [Oscillospiraceae bacterium]|nr:YfhO family protein [Oscillospiraceae bacterium]